MPTTALRRLLPFLSWWPRVDRKSLRADAIAGLISAIVVLPQGVAFATLAGMPPEYGLYCAMVPAVIAAFFGSSWHAVSGPTNAVSIFVFATVSPLAIPGSAEYISLVLTLSFMTGAMMLAMGLLNAGRLVNFISHTVVVGFTAGAGTLIIASQLRNFFGLDVPSGGAFLTILQQFVSHFTETNLFVALIGMLTLAAGMIARRALKKVPYMVVALLAGGVVAFGLNFWLGETKTGIRTLGTLAGALPRLSAPDFSADTIKTLMGIAFGVTVLSLTEATSIGRAIALRSGQRIDGNQEFIGQGLANIGASFFSGYPTSASFNRSGINYEAGARTPLAAALSAPILIAILLLVAPLVAYIPIASMAAILFMVAWGLFDMQAMRTIWRTSRTEAAVLVFTYAATLIMNLEMAILTGVMLSLVVYLNRTSRPQMRSLVPDPRHADRRFAPLAEGLAECPQTKILSIEGSIYFGAVDHVDARLDTLREVSRPQKHLLLLCRNVNFIDVAGAEALAHEARKRRWDGGRLYLYGLRQPVEDVLRNSGLIAEIGADLIFNTKGEAIATLFGRLDRSVCARCTARIFRECAALPAPESQAPGPAKA
ncbi:MAG: SulP family inorganic anion transporter [Proteobacteria bacterium]|nr:SulP family inorganic anion transporter [Pseudomonadota bacterium]